MGRSAAGPRLFGQGERLASTSACCTGRAQPATTERERSSQLSVALYRPSRQARMHVRSGPQGVPGRRCRCRHELAGRAWRASRGQQAAHAVSTACCNRMQRACQHTTALPVAPQRLRGLRKRPTSRQRSSLHPTPLWPRHCTPKSASRRALYHAPSHAPLCLLPNVRKRARAPVVHKALVTGEHLHAPPRSSSSSSRVESQGAWLFDSDLNRSARGCCRAVRSGCAGGGLWHSSLV